MSTTHVPAPDPLNLDVTTSDVLAHLHVEHLTSQTDLDKAGDPEDASYYAGRVDVIQEIKALLTSDTKPEDAEPRGIRFVADYQLMSDEFTGESWCAAFLGEAVRTGKIAGYKFTGAHTGAYGLQFVTFTVDVPFSDRFPATIDAVNAASKGADLLNEIAEDSDVQVRWACGAAW